MTEILPWHQGAWETLLEARRAGRFPHALLLTGPRGIGLGQFSRQLAAGLLCREPLANGLACHACKACRLIKAGYHPDLFMAMPEAEGKPIKIDQIRELIEFVSLKSQYERDKIGIIDPADAMNRNAANSLLKTLEEPPPSSRMLLLSHRPSFLPVTVRSRCQRVDLIASPRSEVIAWLASRMKAPHEPEDLLSLAGNGPLGALRMLEEGAYTLPQALLDDLEALSLKRSDPVTIAQKWLSVGPAEVIGCLMRLTVDMARLKLTPDPPTLTNKSARNRLKLLIKPLDLTQVLDCYERLSQHHVLLSGYSNVNAQSLLEDVTIQWAEYRDTNERSIL